jgi:hypothetical protein
MEGADVTAGPGNPGRPGFPGGEWREFIPDQVFNGGNPGAPGEPGRFVQTIIIVILCMMK